MGWITGADALEFLQAAGLVGATPAGAEALLDFEGAAAAAQEEFERSAGWSPFLAGDAEETRYFDPPRCCLLDLGAGLLSVSGVSVGGVSLTLNRDVFLAPANAAVMGLCGTRLDFAWEPCGGLRSIAVTGLWGRVLELPAEVRFAVLARSGALMAPQLLALRSQGVSRWREGDVEQWSGVEPFGAVCAGWQESFDRTVRRYRRWAVG